MIRMNEQQKELSLQANQPKAEKIIAAISNVQASIALVNVAVNKHTFTVISLLNSQLRILEKGRSI